MNRPLALAMLLASAALAACSPSSGNGQRSDIKLTVVAVTDAQPDPVTKRPARHARMILDNSSKASIELVGTKDADSLQVGAPNVRFERKLSNGKWDGPFKDGGALAQSPTKLAVAPGSQVELSAVLDEAMGTAKFPDATWRVCLLLTDRGETCSQDFPVYTPEKHKS
jgi:hypothetical protein